MFRKREGEEVLYRGEPDRALLGVWTFSRVLWYSLIGVGAVFLALIWIAPFQLIGGYIRGGSSFVPIGIGILILVFLYHLALFKTYRYHVTDRRAVFSGGILYKTTKSLPKEKMTDIERKRNILEQVFGVESIKIHTAGVGKAAPEITFEGLEDADEAYATLNDLLS